MKHIIKHVSVQENDDGGRLTGIMKLDFYYTEFDDTLICSATSEFTHIRQ